MLGNIAALRRRPGVDAVVSPARVAAVDAPQVPAGDWDQVFLVDDADPANNPNLHFVLHDAAEAVAQLRSEGKRVFLHCVEARSPTPSVAALHAVRQGGLAVDDAVRAVADVLPTAGPKPFLTEAIRRCAGAPAG
ncbi:hypothetical protein GCM10027418_01700 [Mariniluteicoccus endophyticus]